MSDDLAAFLLARVAEDEQVARDALAVSGAGDWELDSLGRIYSPSLDRIHHSTSPALSDFTVHAMVSEPPDECYHEVFSNEHAATHCIRWDPARVLAECEAKRRTVEWCVEVIGDRDLTSYGRFGCLREERWALAVTLAMETMRWFAVPHADHPDYRAEWRP